MMSYLIIGILIYVFGFFLSLVLLHKYGERLNWANYDPPHGDYYDDYESNATAYLSFSIMWPLFWFMNSIAGIWTLMKRLSENIGKKINENGSRN